MTFCGWSVIIPFLVFWLCAERCESRRRKGNGGLAIANGPRPHVQQRPPMGFNTWNAYACDLDKLNESNIRRIAVLFNETGLIKAGYDIFVIDDCWSIKDHRHPLTNRLMPDPLRFPSGMYRLGEFIKSVGMRFGLYADLGTHTCEGYPGTLGNETLDAQTFAEWGVDYLKVDGCNLYPNQMQKTYTKLSNALRNTGRPIYYSCSWPAYTFSVDPHTNLPINSFDWDYIDGICDSWRLYTDIFPRWDDIIRIMDFWAVIQEELAPITKKGGTSDPDFLQVGSPFLTTAQAMSQMAVWSIVSAPLILSSDLLEGQNPKSNQVPQLRDEILSILTNPEIIEVNQQLPRRHGKRLFHNNKYDIWTTYMTRDESVVMVVVNRLDTAQSIPLDTQFLKGLLCKSTPTRTCHWGVPTSIIAIRDLWRHIDTGHTLQSNLSNRFFAPPHGSVALKFTVIQANNFFQQMGNPVSFV